MFYGYHSDELPPRSAMPVVVRCDNCCQYRILSKYNCRDLCRVCAQIERWSTDEAHRNASESQNGVKKLPFTDEHRLNMSNAQKNRAPFTDEQRLHMSIAQASRHRIFPHTYESRRKSSATRQGIPYEEWDGFVRNGAYCEKFDEACRERIRDKYNRMCFICSKHESEETRKLSVHHVDMDKTQGCDGTLWKLVPLCRRCHAKSHFDPMKSRIEYILKIHG